MMLRTLVAIGSLILLALPASAERLRWSSQGDALSLDPHANNETMTLRFLSNVYDALVTRDKDLKIVPWLATEWKIVEPTRWRFSLRRDVSFHEGSKMTADDVIFSVARASSKTSGVSSHAAGIKAVEKIDDYTIDVVTEAPRPILLSQLANVYIMDRAWAEKNNAVPVANNNANLTGYTTLNENGTGAYRVKERVPGQRTVLVRNPTWWGKSDGNVDEVVFTPIGAAPTRLAALLSGEVDMINPVPLQDVERVKTTAGLKIVERPEIRTVYFGMNQALDKLSTGEPNAFKDKRVREAVYRAIDIEAIKRVVMRGASTPAGILVGPGITGYDEALNVRLAFDPQKSKTLLTEAGFPNGFSFQLQCPNDRLVNDEAICVALSTMLARVGIKANLSVQTKSIHFQKLQTQDVDMFMQSWASNSYDAYEALFYNLVTRDQDKPETKLAEGQGTWNSGRYRSPALDALMVRIGSETDPAKRQALIVEAHKIYTGDIAIIPMHQQWIAWGVRSNVDVAPLADDSVNLRTVTVNR
ncbi:MAG: ABC transporter substrate-binding protein [Proteobacteria bacterium]|nr:ABC transporter substrate-binding protein [Pseudomonadota bacterium]